MRNRALIVVLAKVAALAVLATAGIACGTPGYNKVPASSPALPYEAPDVDELTGIDPDEEEPADAEPDPEPAEGSAQNPQP